jgi:hypothetical protein
VKNKKMYIYKPYGEKCPKCPTGTETGVVAILAKPDCGSILSVLADK